MPNLTLDLSASTLEEITQLANAARPPRTPEQMAAALVCMALVVRAQQEREKAELQRGIESSWVPSLGLAPTRSKVGR